MATSGILGSRGVFVERLVAAGRIESARRVGSEGHSSDGGVRLTLSVGEECLVTTGGV